jgi:hypothetical protein
MTDRYAIDRFENGDWAVLEDDQARTFRLPRQWLPSEAKEGDIVRVVEYGATAATRRLELALDSDAREERLDRARKLRNQLPRGPKGDVSL